MDCPTEFAYEDYLTKFEVVCVPWCEFIDYVKDTWLILHKKRLVKALTNKVMHLGSKTINRNLTYNTWSIKLVFVYNIHFTGTFVSNLFCRVESAHWALK